MNEYHIVILVFIIGYITILAIKENTDKHKIGKTLWHKDFGYVKVISFVWIDGIKHAVIKLTNGARKQVKIKELQ